jgi:hypothetical protein
MTTLPVTSAAPDKDTISGIINLRPEQFTLYPSSYVRADDSELILCKIKGTKKILAIGRGKLLSGLSGDCVSETAKLCPLSHGNRLILNQYLPYTAPTAFGKNAATFGTGDRLGLATPGHIRCFRNSKAKPVLAQQSKRELDLTGRTYEQVLDDVCFAVFQEGYRGGFGADGDHLKKIEDIREALDCGYTMITLDCSEKIGRGIENPGSRAAVDAYEKLSDGYRGRIERSYLGKGFVVSDEEYFFSIEELMRCALIYAGAVDFVKEVYYGCLKKAGYPVDFELSIDETESVTSAEGHLFVAMELEYYGVEVTSMAPRFIGEFQKGIDYIGDLSQFEDQLKQHANIARHFGYKLSIHSGSDKFTVFPTIGKYTGGLLHVKTSGTSWLEAVGAVAELDPALYRKIHDTALEHFDEAKEFYHVSGDPGKVEDPAGRKDEALADYLKDDNARQLLHITYGYILANPGIKKELCRILEENEDHYYGRLVSHIGRHLAMIGLAGV